MYRLIGGFFGIFSLAIYLFFLYIGAIEWRQNASIHNSPFQELRFLIGLVFGAGLPPLIVAFSYLFFLDSLRKLLVAFCMIVTFIALHYITLVWAAHGSVYVYIPLALGELILSIWLAYKLTRNPATITSLNRKKFR